MKDLGGLWTIVMVVAAGAVGVLVGMSMDSGDGGEDAPVATGARRPEAASPTDQPIQLRGAPRANVRGSAAEDPAFTELERAVRALPVPQVTRGRGAVTGFVRTDDGQPVADARVVGQAVRSRERYWRSPSGRVPSDAETRSSLHRRIQAMLWAHANQVSAITGADGSYRLEGLLDYEYTLSAFAVACAVEPAGNARVRPGDTADFIARTVVPVAVHVVLPGGSTPESVNIQLRAGVGSHSRYDSAYWTADEPTVYLRPGVYTVTATAGDEQEYRVADVPLEIDPGASSAALDLILVGRRGIRGSLVPPADEIVDNYSVRLLRVPAGSTATAQRLATDGHTTWVHRRGNQGLAYSFMDLEPGTYAIGVARSHNGKIYALRTVEVADGITELDLDVPPPDRADYVIVRAFGPDGNVLRELSFSTAWRSERSSSSGGGAAIAHKDGSFWVPHHNTNHMGQGRAGQYFVTVTSAVYGSRELEYARGPRAELTVRFSDPGTLEITLAGYAGSGHEGRFNVQLKPAREGAEDDFPGFVAPSSGKPSSEGVVSFAGLEPGEYIATLLVTVDRHRAIPATTVPVSVSVGANAIRVDLPELHPLTVTVPAGSGGNVRVRDGEDKHGFRSIGRSVPEDGVVEFPPLPAGRYKIQRYVSNKQEEQVISLPSSATIRFTF